jgi:hypothetical protein
LLQSRAVDETGHVQPSIQQLRAVRGVRSIYHNNAGADVAGCNPTAKCGMSRLPSALCVLALTAAAALPAGAQQGRYGLGRAPTAQEIAAWDIDVRPDGHGVRPGRGTVAQGQKIYDAQCASCHGTFGESNRYMAVAGGVRQSDLKTGRASVLLQSDGLRTLGTKAQLRDDSVGLHFSGDAVDQSTVVERR